ncbi:hypothetical protein LTR85_010305 [Meristemomyces frigidus]|nr:hypothetical protein LTR85_010305 [Meristemomyces frigidus]
MSPPLVGFDQSEALELRRRAADKNKWTRILDAIEEVSQMLRADGLHDEESHRSESAWEQLLTPATFSRRVTVPRFQRVNVQCILKANTLYNSEQQFLTDAHRSTLTQLFEKEEESLTEIRTTGQGGEVSPWIEPLTDGERLLLLRAVESKTRLDVDDATRLNGFASFTAEPTMNDEAPLYGQAILTDFFKVCDDPTDAELYMLTDVCELDDFMYTVEWFDQRVKDLESVDLAEKLLKKRRSRLYNKLFRRTSEVNTPVEPNAKNGLGDGGGYDAYDPSASVPAVPSDNMLNIPWSLFFNEDGMA